MIFALILFHVYSDYILLLLDNTTSSHDTTVTLSRGDIYLSNTSCQCHLTTCAKLITNELIGVVCVDHINLKVRVTI